MNASARTLDSTGPGEPLFHGFFMGGFECSTHRLKSGRRLDMVAASEHDRWCDRDYARLKEQGICVAREGLRWHLIEKEPGQYDFSSAVPIVQAARQHGIQVLWDLCHYGWPDGIDIFSPVFVQRYCAFATRAAQWLANELSGRQFFAPINEISFFSWAGGDDPHLAPYCRGRGFELKCQLVRAAVEAMAAISSALPGARFVHIDPLIHIVPKGNRPNQAREAEGYRLAQFQAFDMLSGRIWPQLGGAEKYLDIIGLNFYPNNEWVYKGQALSPSDPRYRPLRDLLREVAQRYSRPLFIAETGTEGRRRPSWFRYVCQEVRAAIDDGVAIHGICLYPIVNHPGWINQRHCQNGLWDYADAEGNRPIYSPLADELDRARRLFASEQEAASDGSASAGAAQPRPARALSLP